METLTAVVAAVDAVIPDTWTGVGLLVVPPSPSWPDPLLPQHFTVPLPVTAHVCRFPASRVRGRMFQGPVPAEFTAATRNTYAVRVSKPVTVIEVDVDAEWANDDHEVDPILRYWTS